MTQIAHPDSILIIDFGSQVTQLIARRIREAGVYCEIHPFQNAATAFEKMQPKGVIFSGGPASVTAEGSPRAPQAVFDSGVPILGICYGQQTLCTQLGGVVEGGHAAEFGRADLEVKAASPLFEGFWEVGGRYPVWMSHGDRVTKLPEGFEVIATSENAPFAIAADESRRYYTTMFHPEVVHTPDGAKLLSNFVHKIVGLKSDWTMAAYRAEMIRKIKEQVGSERVICGLSGGVDSSVAAVLIHEAIGDQLTCIYVDHGLMRQGESEQVVGMFRDHYNIPLVHVDASDLFLTELAGVTDPEVKRKTIGRLFIEVFDAEATKIAEDGKGVPKFLARARSIRT
jgi:GMP synthase (glutamine-hydrolysing)